MRRRGRADITPVRQRTQFTCMATSMMMCLQTQGVQCDEDEVASVMGVRPMQGATWEDAIACAQHYGMRAVLVCPATVQMLKRWTDQGIPVMIAWNPEGRDWSHASTVFDVEEREDGLYIHVADPNIPNPTETVRVVHEDDFYGRWSEKWPKYLVRRPAMAVMREISPEGKQMAASEKTSARKPKGWPTGTNAFTVYDLIKDHGFVPDRVPSTDFNHVKRVLVWGGLEKRPGGGFQLTDKGRELLDEYGYLSKLPRTAAVRLHKTDSPYVLELPKSFKKLWGSPVEVRQNAYGDKKWYPVSAPGVWALTGYRTPQEAAKAAQQIVEIDNDGNENWKKAAGVDPPYKQDGKPIYPKPIDHGYDQPLSGGFDMMKRLQDELVQEQGRPDWDRPDNPRLAAMARRVVRRFLLTGEG